MKGAFCIAALVLSLAVVAHARELQQATKCPEPINQVACRVTEDGYVTNIWFGGWGTNTAASCPANTAKAGRPSWGKALPVASVCADEDFPNPEDADFLDLPNTRTSMGVITEMRWVAAKDYSGLRRVTFTVRQYDRVAEDFVGDAKTLTCGDTSSKLDKNPANGWKAPNGLVFGSMAVKCEGASLNYPSNACFTSPAWYPQKQVAGKTC